MKFYLLEYVSEKYTEDGQHFNWNSSFSQILTLYKDTFNIIKTSQGIYEIKKGFVFSMYNNAVQAHQANLRGVKSPAGIHTLLHS